MLSVAHAAVVLWGKKKDRQRGREERGMERERERKVVIVEILPAWGCISRFYFVPKAVTICARCVHYALSTASGRSSLYNAEIGIDCTWNRINIRGHVYLMIRYETSMR